VAVVVPTKDRPTDLEVTIKSLLCQTALPQQLIVIDQSVSDESQIRVMALLEALAPQRRAGLATVYERDTSLSGLTAARNRALELVRAEIVLFFDDDVILESDFIEQALSVFRDHPDAVGVSGIVTNYSRPPAFYRYWSRIFMRGPFWDDRQPVYWRASQLRGGPPVRVTRLGGGLMAFRLAAISGFRFNEDLRGACPGEDVDFCASLNPDALLLITPNARLVHKQSPAARVPNHWLTTHASTLSYLYYRHWNRGIRNQLCFAWLNAGYGLAATLSSGRRFSFASWRGLATAIRHSRRLARVGSTRVMSPDQVTP
jgi:GT2 family glycosyltransferase